MASSWVVWALLGVAQVSGQVLTPPYFNLAEGRRITATATCGEGVDEPELFCKLVGANSDKSAHFNVIQGQLCDYCDPSDQENSHPPKYAIDGSERWWQSPPLSRGMDYNAVNLTIDLGQLFQVAYVILKMGNSPRPGVWALERSVDDGKSYTPWQYFADSKQDCELFFGPDTVHPILQDDDVICTSQFSKVVPLEGGEIVVSLLNGRPSSETFFNSTALQEFTRATNIRLRLLRTKTLLGHLMSVAQRDSTVTRRYFYSIKDISIGGRCVCNGHASVCDITDPRDQYKLHCRCEHNTCGSQCEECCPGFIQKKWRSASYTENFVCEPCNCFGHSGECIYDEQVDLDRKSIDIHGIYEGGGVCQNCRHNTKGINCDECQDGFYRPTGRYLNDTNVCEFCNCIGHFYTGNCREGDGLCQCKVQYQAPNCDSCSDGYYSFPDCFPCDCHRDGTVDAICQVGGGQCPCKENFSGLNCDQCAPGYYNFPDCIPCNCHSQGSLDNECNQETGQCSCLNKYGGKTCSQCGDGFYDFENGCEICNCDTRGATAEICDKSTGDCLCQEGYSSERCDTNAPGFWGYPLVQICGCNEKGSSSRVCDVSGNCPCLRGYSGRACSQCSPGYFNFPDCEPCNCDASGSIGVSCDAEGHCQCKSNFDGQHCDSCKAEFYNFPLCEACNCNPAGVLETFLGCGNAPVGELCECKARVTGRICNQCRSLFWNLQDNNPFGCEDCACYMPGTLGTIATCDPEYGQCVCKPNVNSRQCEECADGTFNLMEDNLFGCSDCNCNIGGSEHHICDKTTGQCQCRHRIEGQMCDKPMKVHYFPTLYQHKYEAEDGRTDQNTPIRFGYDNVIFSDFSGRGYAVFSELQKKTVYDIYISQPTLYRVIFYYRNMGDHTIDGKITVIPDNPQDDQQILEVHFPPTDSPQLMTAGAQTGIPVPLVLNPGRWQLSIEAIDNMFLDYFVLLPQSYYEATILTEKVSRYCQLELSSEPCLHYNYPDDSDFEIIYGSAGYVDAQGYRSTVQLYTDRQVLDRLESGPMAWLNDNQKKIQFDVRLRRPVPHVLIINYYTPSGAKATNVAVTINTGDRMQRGRTLLYDCTYSWTCRQVISNLRGEVGKFEFDENYVNIVIERQGEMGADIALQSVVMVPFDDWSIGMVKPSPVCVKVNDECAKSQFPSPAESTKIEFETNLGGKSADTLPRGVDNSTILVYLNETNRMVDLAGKLRAPGRYIFIVQYYMPKHAESTLYALVQNGRFYEGSLHLRHCPSTTGCRAVVALQDGSIVFDILENFIISLKGDNKEVWLDYIQVVPEAHFSEKHLQEVRRDNTAKFFERCAQNNFYIDPQETGYCRDAVFSLTADYNNGALPCQCNSDGSLSFECETFGGQCTCKPNVIGRECDRCKTGYFGFPYCRPCDCPSTALCDANTGDCICPPKVVGEKCERCAAYTYGYDPLIGCEECRCDENGVRNGDLQCDLLVGQCNCKERVIGRRCDRCESGYWAFPFCQLCNCDLRGTEADICSQSDATCFCKSNTEGAACELCKRGSYNLEESNPDGCTKCFCFGKSQACSSSNFFWTSIRENDGWEAVTLNFESGHIVQSNYNEEVVTMPNGMYLDLVNASDTARNGNLVYFMAPPTYLGNKISSYGGILSFTLQADVTDVQSELGRDIILKGNNLTAVYIFLENQIKHRRPEDIKIKILERNFQTLYGEPMKREQLMMLLYNIESFYIRAQYTANPDITRLTNMQMAHATNEYRQTREAALSVEQCQCPPGYKGSSCEDCADGYFRANSGTFGGYCIPCECNNHADTCDPVTGVCKNCKNNTVGDHCEKCGVGHFGVATDGTPHDCLMCSCPMPSISNNFALSCEVDVRLGPISCNCRPGYTGRTCEKCDAGFYGRPTEIGSYCRQCECNDNIDASDPYACDDISGICLKCQNNTYGARCERCAPFYYGDAINSKDCQECSCVECGSRSCNHRSGHCECQINVIGDTCDRCAQDHWGYSSCRGCEPCNCQGASERTQCDFNTGQCPCKPGVTGRYCDVCMPGFWDYSNEGCKECSCREGFSIGVGCDPLTGQCSCLPGVIGDYCERCPHRWVLIEGVGCQECDDCIHDLLDSTDALSNLIYPVINEYAAAKQSFFLHKRLQLLNQSVDELKPLVQAMDLTDEDVKPVNESLRILEGNALQASQQATQVHGHANEAATNGEHVKKDAEEILQDILNGAEFGQTVVEEINAIVVGLEIGAGARIELAIEEAQEILEKIKLKDFSKPQMEVDEETEIAREYLDRVANISSPVAYNQETLEGISTRLTDLENKIKEIQEYVQTSKENSYNAQDTINKIRASSIADLKNKHAEIARLGETAKTQNNQARNYTDIASKNFYIAEDNYRVLGSELDSLKVIEEMLNQTVAGEAEELEKIQDLSREAIDHAHDLMRQADEIDGMLTDTRFAAENALSAANAYDNIVDATNTAYEAALAANNASSSALDMSSGLMGEASNATIASREIDAASTSSLNEVHNSLIPQLDESEKSVAILEAMNDFTVSHLNNIDEKLRNLRGESVKEEAISLQEVATEAEDEATRVSDLVDERHDQLVENAEKVRQLTSNFDEARRDMMLAFEQVGIVESKLPEMGNRTNNLKAQGGRLHNRLQNIGERLEQLRRNIAKTREQTNKIEVGVDFEYGSLVELKNPEDLSDSATSTEISFYINTRETIGLPLFWGTPLGGNTQLHRTSTDDFMSVEIDGGYVRLTTNLGAGPHSITNSKFVADGEWHQINIKRVGKVVKLSVHSADKDGNEVIETAEKVLPGTYSILNLDPKVSKLYVGGVPPGEQIDSSIISTNYNGKIEHLWINKKPMGLWNFLRRDPPDAILNGAKERDSLKGTVTMDGLRFDGKGYALLETKDMEISDRFSIQLSFKTFAEEALLLLLENGPGEFVSVELREGRVFYQQNFGTAGTMITQSPYNDDKLHVVEISKAQNQFLMKIIDSGEQVQGQSTDTKSDFTKTPDVVFFGGYPGRHRFPDVTNEDFRGCIIKAEISEKAIDFSKSKESLGTTPGCPEAYVNLVSFHREQPGYAQLKALDGNGLQLVFKFKTEFPNGLLFYTATADQSLYLSLSLSDGALVLRSAPGAELTTGTYTMYNDSAWHFVIATRENNELRLDIDDFEKYSIELIQESAPFDGPVFFGGVPKQYNIPSTASAVDSNFFGCIGDVTLNGRILDFSSAAKSDRPGAILATCELSKEDMDPIYTGSIPDIDLSLPKVTAPPTTTTSTTTAPTTQLFTDASMTSVPLTECALPERPRPEKGLQPSDGARFGFKRDSRVEFDDFPSSLRYNFEFSLQFKTPTDEGMLIYASNLNHRKYVTVYLKDGKVVYSFNTGSGAITLRSKDKYNDEEWHTIIVKRDGKKGILEIDGYEEASASALGDLQPLITDPPYYLGGVNTSSVQLVRENTEQTDLSLNGCLRSFRLNGKLIGGERKTINVQRCSKKVELGTFFGAGPRSHVVVRPRFDVGTKFSMSFDIKPRRSSGVIMSVHGRKDYIMLQMREGVMEFQVDNGKAPIFSIFEPPHPYYFCDGQWHSIKVIKNRNLIVLAIDNVHTVTETGPPGTLSADTNNPLFLGSQPRLSRRRGQAVPQKYVGCIRNVMLNEEPINLAYALFVGNVNGGVCSIL